MISLLLTHTIISLMVSSLSATETPVIGIVLHEIMRDTLKSLSPNSTAYLAASYVKAVEAAGAKVAVIKLGEEESYYR